MRWLDCVTTYAAKATTEMKRSEIECALRKGLVFIPHSLGSLCHDYYNKFAEFARKGKVEEIMDEKEKFIMSWEMLDGFRKYLEERENTEATVRKYISDIRVFMQFMREDREVNKEKLIGYKQWLSENYALSSANSMIAALNQFLICFGVERWKLRRFKVQTQCFREEEKELTQKEYRQLRMTAEQLESRR